MHGNGSDRKIFAAMAFIIWSAIVLSAFYVTQRPLFFQVLGGMGATLWAIALTMLLLIDSAGIGQFLFNRMHLKAGAHEQLILGTGLGLCTFGLAGYGLGAAGLAGVPILGSILIGILILVMISKYRRVFWSDLRSLLGSFTQNRNGIPVWLPPAVLTAALLGFFFALLPPAEGFDGLFYHLALPERLLADTHILPYNIPQFWFPGLIEGDFLWALGLHSERTAQLIHWSFSLLTLSLIWEWARNLFGPKTAWWALAVVISMPSLPWLAAWAYTDFALTFVGLAGLYALRHWKETRENQWLTLAGIFTGMAMSIKYTSFLLPVMCVILIQFFERDVSTRITAWIRFSAPAVFTALPWYLRNWLVMGNPFYPFVFGGRDWDAFRTNWYAGPGTGIGWDLREILLLPFTITLGHRDQNFYDGRLGPLFLLLLPLALWVLWINRSAAERERGVLLILAAFAGVNYLFWTFSLIQTIHLWQSRLLLPGLVPFAIPIGLGITHLDQLDLPRLRIGFITTRVVGLVIALALIDNCLSLIVRRPLHYALGLESRQAYFERIQPRYSEALALVAAAPQEAQVYFIFEPRSYNMPRKVQPDPINDNLAHDYHLYTTAERILQNWKGRGYTHILVYIPGSGFFSSNAGAASEAQLNDILKNLNLENRGRNYTLYSIP